jgi:hypothetical protein
MTHRTVRCTNVVQLQTTTLGNLKTGLSGEPAEQRLSAPTVDFAKATVSRQSQKH